MCVCVGVCVWDWKFTGFNFKLILGADNDFTGCKRHRYRSVE